MRKSVLITVMIAASGSALAQSAPADASTQAPPPPVFKAERALALDLPPNPQMRVGVDPDTISIGTDNVVRYVVVARASTGLVNAFYEGLRCDTAEVITYARTLGDAPWTAVEQPAWASLAANRPSRHALQFARQAACEGFTRKQTVREIVQALKN